MNIQEIILTEIAEKQFIEVQYSLDNGGVASDADVINYALEQLHAFETIMDGQSITDWLYENKTKEYGKYLGNDNTAKSTQ